MWKRTLVGAALGAPIAGPVGSLVGGVAGAILDYRARPKLVPAAVAHKAAGRIIVKSGSGKAKPAPSPKPLSVFARLFPATTPQSRADADLQERADRASARALRPSPSAAPSDIAAFLNSPAAHGFGPYQLYPEWGWVTPAQAHGFGGGASWVAYWDYGNGEHVNWWVNPDGSWGYHHTWGGVNLGQTLDSIANVVSTTAAALGMPGAGQFVYLLHALAGHGSPAVLGAALKGDYDNLQAAGNLASAVKGGDWGKVWDQATKSGRDLSGIKAAFDGHPPDRNGNPT